MKIRPVLQAHASSRRLVVVPAVTPDGHPQSYVFAIRRTGLDGEVRARGAVMALGPVLFAIAKQEATAQERQATLDAAVNDEIRAQLQADFDAQDALAAQGQPEKTPEEMVAQVTDAFYDGIVPVLGAAVESMGLLKPGLEGLAGLLEAKHTAAGVCQDLDPGTGKPVYLDPITVVAGPEASVEKNEFALSNLDETQRNLLVASVLSYVVGQEAAKEVVPVPDAAVAAQDRGRVGQAVQPAPPQAPRTRLGAKRSRVDGSRPRVPVRGTGG